MQTVTVSPKYQVVIPRALRKQLNVRPGQKVEVLVYEGRIELIPVKKPKSLRGFLRGIDTSVARDRDRT
jgi:AbrB family looped-hinge helix DNA binding protein